MDDNEKQRVLVLRAALDGGEVTVEDLKDELATHEQALGRYGGAASNSALPLVSDVVAALERRAAVLRLVLSER